MHANMLAAYCVSAVEKHNIIVVGFAFSSSCSMWSPPVASQERVGLETLFDTECWVAIWCTCACIEDALLRKWVNPLNKSTPLKHA